MKWKKEQFLITKFVNNEMFRAWVEGITTQIENCKIGIHKNGKDWIVTDISTGYMLHISFTQKDAKSWVDIYSDIIVDYFNKPKHDKLVKEVEQCSVR